MSRIVDNAHPDRVVNVSSKSEGPQPISATSQSTRSCSTPSNTARSKGVVRPSSGDLQPANTHAALDCLSGLSAAVLFAFTAVESLANPAIEMLPDDAVVTLRKGRELPKAELTTGLGIDDKLKRVVPLLDQGAKVAGTGAWERYLELKFLRDELLHVKARGYDPDPDVTTAYDRLMLGEGDRCVEDAKAVVESAFPGFLPDEVLEALV